MNILRYNKQKEIVIYTYHISETLCITNKLIVQRQQQISKRTINDFEHGTIMRTGITCKKIPL